MTYDIEFDPATLAGTVITLDDSTQELSVALDGTVDADDLIGET